MRILVTGAFGFIGSHLVGALADAGHEVVCAARRSDRRFARFPFIPCDFSRDIGVEDWLPRLTNIDAVVNAAGILRESKGAKFDAVHHDAPLALFQACVRSGVKKVVQISALGDPRDGAFLASKHRLDADLQKLDLQWVILRPGLVYSVRGSYGGTSLLRALAATPWLLAVPGDGQQSLQPVAMDDLAQAVVRCVAGSGADRQQLEVVGPNPLTFETYLRSWRDWLGIPVHRLVRIPLRLIEQLAQLGEKLGRGPLGLTMHRMLERGNVGAAGAVEAFTRATGIRPRQLDDVLRACPSQVQDRWHARLYLLEPFLRLSLAFLFIASGIAGFRTPTGTATQLLGYLGVPSSVAPVAMGLVSAFDMALGIGIMTTHFRRAAQLMLAVVVGYTVLLGYRMSGLWFEPFGSLVKNIPLIPTILVYLVLSDRR